MKRNQIKIVNSFLCTRTEYKTLSLRLDCVSDSQGFSFLKNQIAVRMSLLLILRSIGQTLAHCLERKYNQLFEKRNDENPLFLCERRANLFL